MKMVGSVDIPQEAFLSVLTYDTPARKREKGK